MSENRFSLTWDVHKNNISDGLSSFQQNGDFVDMTLAADGHYVKVHQVMLAVASPYLKQIISELNCPHPVIFLNRISYETLSSLLEYIYTGEVLVALEHLNDIVEAAKELHIRGLENMTVKILSNNGETKDMIDDDEKTDEQEQICFVEMKSEDNSLDVSLDQADEDEVSQPQLAMEAADESEPQAPSAPRPAARKNKFVPSIIAKSKEMHSKILKSNVMQYTISNQGSLQMILNRYIYYLKHINRDNSKQWRCVDYVNKLKCPAIVFTKDDLVTQRISAHTHPFHDRRIFKKAQANAIFSAINEAVLSDKNKNSQNISDEEA